MPVHVVDFQLSTGRRDDMRRALIELFLSENPGAGKGDRASRYQYNVEEYGPYGIFLKRPTQLNKGFDFTVHIRGVYFKKRKKYSNPSHHDIYEALWSCKTAYPGEYAAVEAAIEAIYCCRAVDLSHIQAWFCDFEGTEHPIQIILLAIKWLFMEQDCAYWNYSGRQMFFEGLLSNGLVG